MSESKGKAIDFKLLMRVISFVKPYRGIFIFTLALVIVMGFLAPVRPALIQKAIDGYVTVEGTEMTQAERFDGLFYYILIIIGLLLVEAIFQFIQTYFTNWIGQTVTIDLRNKLYNHTMGFRLQFFDKTPIGQLVTRLVSDIDGIAEIFSQGLFTIFGDLLKLVVVVVVMFVINWKLALIVLIPIPILLFATRIFKNAIKKAFIQVRNKVSQLNTFVQEHLTGMNIVQIFNREKQEMEKFREINKDHRAANIKSIWAYAIFFPVVEMLSATSIALLLWLGLSLMSPTGDTTEGVSYGNLTQYIMYVFMLYRPIRQLADRFNTLQMGIVNAERVFKLYDHVEHMKKTDAPKTVENLKGDIEFDQVWFAYNAPEYVLKDLSFSVNAGETIAFVGATGAGKSSVINLLSRFYEFQKGSITVDGHDIREYGLETIRQNISVVLQDVFLFSDTIHNNITLNNPNITREQVIDAAKKVGAHTFIDRLPGGYDYDVKERGGTLSVGQRQLIAFIRAYVYDPSILVLDEATSSVDTESEHLIQNAIAELTKGRTSIVIAHRLSTIQSADKIIVLEAGEIIEMGSHQELLEQGGQYKKLFELQFHVGEE